VFLAAQPEASAPAAGSVSDVMLLRPALKVLFASYKSESELEALRGAQAAGLREWLDGAEQMRVCHHVLRSLLVQLDLSNAAMPRAERIRATPLALARSHETIQLNRVAVLHRLDAAFERTSSD
jgi:hypothetical protein